MIQQAGAAMPSEKDLGRMEAIVLSMTVQERSHPEVIKGSRRKRIAAGSGTTIADVNRLLKGFEQMQGMFKSLGGKGTKGIRGKTRLLRQLKNIDPTQLGQAGL
jgi:signal recognition particle subunit SRP54